MSSTLGTGRAKHWGYILGMAAVFAVYSFVMWIQSDIDLSEAVQKAQPHFYAVEEYTDSLQISQIMITGSDGNAFDLGQYKGQFVLLNIWATWCAPCIKELPTLESLKQYYVRNEGDWTVIAVSIDTQKDIMAISKFLDKYSIGDSALYHDSNGDLQKFLSFDRLPTSFIIAPNGRILYRVTGGSNWFKKDIINFLDAIKKRY